MSASPYTLNIPSNTPVELQRLERNHWELWLPLFNGTLLPPHILDQLSASSTACVADVGTGTGVWLVSLASELPNTAGVGTSMPRPPVPPSRASNADRQSRRLRGSRG